MIAFLVLFTHYVDMNLFFGVIEIFLGILIYFGALWLIKGIGKEDLELITSFLRK